MNGALRIATIAGIPIRIHLSWLAVYALITWTLAIGYFPRVLPELPTIAHWGNGLLAALLLFASVLLHELSHAVVARRRGLEVRGITLHVFGGVSQLESEPPTPRAELAIALAGPVMSFAIAGALWGVRASGALGPGSARAVVDYLLFVNVVVGVFNLLPGFPLDGGRVLRAILWARGGGLAEATRQASRVGIGFAYVMMALGVFQIFSGAVVGGFWWILIGLFLKTAADASYKQVAVRGALERVPVKAIMTRDVVTVGARDDVATLVRRFWSHHVTSFPVVDGGVVRGVAALGDLRADSADASGVTVDRMMRPLGEDLTIGPTASAFQALEKATRNNLGRLVVLEDGRLVGYLSLKDIMHALALQSLSEDLRAAAPRPRELGRAA